MWHLCLHTTPWRHIQNKMLQLTLNCSEVKEYLESIAAETRFTWRKFQHYTLNILCVEPQYQIINSCKQACYFCTYLPKLNEAYICAIRIKQYPVQKESQPASWNFSSRSSDWPSIFNLASCGSETDQQMPFMRYYIMMVSLFTSGVTHIVVPSQHVLSILMPWH
jgi:hypothetical protein